MNISLINIGTNVWTFDSPEEIRAAIEYLQNDTFHCEIQIEKYKAGEAWLADFMIPKIQKVIEYNKGKIEYLEKCV